MHDPGVVADFAEKGLYARNTAKGRKIREVFLTYCPVIANYVGGGLEYTIVPI